MVTLQQQVQQLQNQLQQLTHQFEQLAAQVEEPTTEQSDIDFEQLVLETSLQPFEYHPAKEQDEYVKTLYLQTLLSVMTYVEQEKEERYRFVARVFNGLVMDERFETYVQRSNMLTTEHFANFSHVVNENQLTNTFLVDALMVLGLHQEKKAVQYVAEIASALGVDETIFKIICQLSVAILQVNHKGIANIIEKFSEIRFAALHYLYAIKSWYGPVLHVLGTGSEVITVKHFNQKEDIYLENVKIILDEKLQFQGVNRVYIKNCEIMGRKGFTLEGIKLVHIESTLIRSFGTKSDNEFGEIVIRQCGKVIMKDLKVKDCTVRNKECLVYIHNVDVLNCRNNHFERIKFYVKGSSFWASTMRKEVTEVIIKAWKVRKIHEQNNTVVNCEVFESYNNSNNFYNRGTVQQFISRK